VGVIAACLLADTVGRRRLIIFGGWWCSAMLLIVGAAGQRATSTPVRNLIIAAACMWSIGNSPLGSLGWTFVGEVPNQKLRARTAGLAAAGGVVFGLTFNTSVPIMREFTASRGVSEQSGE
jgi:MFS family permease